MNLYVDIGNSRIRLAVETDTVLISFPYGLETLGEDLAGHSGALAVPDRIIVSNVAGDAVADAFSAYCDKTWSTTPEFLRVTAAACGVTNGYLRHGQLGVDRWLAMIAGWNSHRGRICVFDCGSAVTADLVEADGTHIGGYIMPGDRLQRRVLNAATAGVRPVGAPAPRGAPGRSTEECLVNGTVLAVAGFIDKIAGMLEAGGDGGWRCLVTGGDAEKIMPFLKVPCQHEPLLVIEGIKLAAGG